MVQLFYRKSENLLMSSIAKIFKHRVDGYEDEKRGRYYPFSNIEMSFSPLK